MGAHWATSERKPVAGRGYTRAYGLQRAGQRPFEVWVRWPWQRRWFSDIAFTPRLKVRMTPRNTSFARGTLSLEVRPFDPGVGLSHSDDAGWRDVYSTWIHEEWHEGKTRRLNLSIPPTLLAGEGTYQCRIELHEREEVDKGEFATLTQSYFYIPVPFRLHGTSTSVPLVAAGIAAAAAVLSLLGALLSAISG